MIVDAQIHVWQADCPERPWPRSGADGRTAIPQRPDPLTAPEAIAAMDDAGVDRAILVPPSWEGDRNDVALAAVRDFPGRFAVMGRVGPDRIALDRWRDQPGMLGARVILSQLPEAGAHWLWAEAERCGVPVMIAPTGRIDVVEKVARAFPQLRLIVDHMGARVHRKGAAAFVDIDRLVRIAQLDNVAVKLSCLPDYSAESSPWGDAMPYAARLFRAFGAERSFWGSDLSRLPCPYGALVEVFRDELSWLSGSDRDAVMGTAILRWLNWR